MTYHIQSINSNIMRKVDFGENELYLTICGKHYCNVYSEKKESPDAMSIEANLSQRVF